MEPKPSEQNKEEPSESIADSEEESSDDEDDSSDDISTEPDSANSELSDEGKDESDTERVQRFALSSTSPSERSGDITVTDSDDSSIKENIPKYELVDGFYVYEEEIVDKLMHKHFKDDDDDISVSSVEQCDFLTRHGWHLSKSFHISFSIPYLPAVYEISWNFRKYFTLSLFLQFHHLFFAVLWTYMSIRFFTVMEEEMTMSFQRYTIYMKPVMVFEAVINFIFPLLGYIRHVNQKIRTLVIFHDIAVFVNVCHLFILSIGGAFSVFVFSHFEEFAEDKMNAGNYTTLWEHTQVIRACCGTKAMLDWKFEQHGDNFELPASCCDSRLLGPVDVCTAQHNAVWRKACFDSVSDEMVTIRWFSWFAFILLTLSLYHNISTHTALDRVRSLLKAMNPHLVYGIPRWVITRHTTPQFNYSMNLDEDDEQLNWEKQEPKPEDELDESGEPKMLPVYQPLDWYMEF